jgi:hypothetical protein
LRPRYPRRGWERSRARGQMQKLPSVGKFQHVFPEILNGEPGFILP